MASSEILVKRLIGEEIAPYVDDLARLRIEIFRGYPYLYDGDLIYEEQYLRRYLESLDSVLVVALDGARVIGVSTGMPMNEADEVFQKPFLELGYDISKIFYLSESVLQPNYRGHGIGVQFFTEREAHVQTMQRFEWACFSAVLRSPDHPARPDDYEPLFEFWKHRGYKRYPEMRTTLTWKGVGRMEPTAEVMEFWLKHMDT
ncbi:MAG: GNAT family N-acetyltransferase [Bradymonadaceae bacterium]|nr:GNAT family N-acetyltransferase [Lujinxingiaceae bacterium]